MGVYLEASISYQLGEDVIPMGDIADPLSKFTKSAWYEDVIYYLHTLQFPDHMDRSLARSLRLNAIKYYILNGQLYWKDPGGVLLSCVNEHEAKKLIAEFHVG